jgi:hypothetical protein
MDTQHTIGIDMANITTMQETIAVNGRRGGIIVLEVAHKDMTASIANLSLLAGGIEIARGVDPHIGAWHRDTTTAASPVLLVGQSLRTTALTHAVQFVDWNVETHKVMQRLLGDRRSTAGHGFTSIQSNGFLDVREHNGVGDTVAPRNFGAALHSGNTIDGSESLSSAYTRWRWRFGSAGIP